jgi:hypothetical protein
MATAADHYSAAESLLATAKGMIPNPVRKGTEGVNRKLDDQVTYLLDRAEVHARLAMAGVLQNRLQAVGATAPAHWTAAEACLRDAATLDSDPVRKAREGTERWRDDGAHFYLRAASVHAMLAAVGATTGRLLNITVNLSLIELGIRL